MPAASILIKPASSNCNIDCKYCFYKCLSSNREEYSKGFMTYETLEKLIINGIDYADGLVSFAFQGGEPTLAGLDFFKKAVEYQKKYNTKGLIVENTIQTNAILINDEWAEFFAENDFLVGVSLDGPKKIHDKYRKSCTNADTFQKVMESISILKQHGVRFNILSVVTEDVCSQAEFLYKFYRRNGFEFVQLIPCMDEEERFHSGERSPFAVTAKSYGEFLCKIFDLWYEDYMKGEAIEIRMFSNLAQIAAGYPSEECGMSGCCSCYFVVEGDGSVYPCDFYCMDEWKLGSVDDKFTELIVSDKVKAFIKNSSNLSEKCMDCEFLRICHGGCRRWREPIVDDVTSDNKLCEAYKIFFEHAADRIDVLAQMIIKKYGKYKV